MDTTPARIAPVPSVRQPWLHELRICVAGNATALSSMSGDIEADTAQGYYVDDRRVLDRLTVRLDGEMPDYLTGGASGPRAEFLTSARNLGNPGPDPTVELLRTRDVGDGLTERLTVTSRADEQLTVSVCVMLSGDEADIGWVKAGHTSARPVPVEVQHGAAVLRGEWHRSRVTTEGPGARLSVVDGRLVMQFALMVPPGGSATATVHVRPDRVRPSMFDADSGFGVVTWDGVRAVADDPRLARALHQGLDDVRHLLLRDPEAADDVFAAAGTPWYLTLFGRDALWAARMLLPFGTTLAGGTLRALARRQGRRNDEASGEAAGKIPHEVRRSTFSDPESGLTLPAVYFGTVDATALWVTLLAEARLWGLPADEVRALIPSLRAAVGWLTSDARPDPDGFLKYLDPSGSGLANQGWKDSGDAVRWRDGRVAQAPIALVEAQAYTVEALRHAAWLYRVLGIDGADRVRQSADELETRTREAFWVTTDGGRYLAIALDADGRAVDGLASNMGHVVGAGVLTRDEGAEVAATLVGEELLDAFGVRTLGSANGGFNPLGYHTGSIWTHDTAIAAWGLAREGRHAEAGAVARTLLASAEVFHYRWPELYAGVPTMGHPAPYPASCRPQAWSAASAGALIQACLGMQPDAPAGTLEVAPLRPQPFGALRVEGLRLADRPFVVEVSADGAARVQGLPAEMQVLTG